MTPKDEIDAAAKVLAHRTHHLLPGWVWEDFVELARHAMDAVTDLRKRNTR